MSPPESRSLDSFTPPRDLKSPSYNTQSAFDPSHKLAPMGKPQTPPTMRTLPSPPISPWVRSKGQDLEKRRDDEQLGEHQGTHDPLLYPQGDDNSASMAAQPLFPMEPPIEDVITKHMKTSMQSVSGRIVQPTQDEYRLVLSCISNIGKKYNANPGRYMKRTLDEAENQYWRTKRIQGKPGFKAGVRPRHIAPTPAATQRQTKKTSKPASSPNAAPRHKRVQKPSPIPKIVNSPGIKLSSPDFRSQPQKRPEDVDFMALPDYTPPVSTLPAGNAKALKADWSSTNVLDLSNDPDRHLLHEAEVNLAATLRLTCATYLCSKRRIFEACVNHYRSGKPDFRKTNAQQACKIDVNKASKLWTAYDRVGWFSREHFQRWL